MPEFERNEQNQNSKGGTELLMGRLYNDLPADLLEKFQIIPSRVRELKEDKLRVLYLHDLAQDPEAKAAVDSNGSWTRFHRLVFVSHWQRNQFFFQYPHISWGRTTVIQNSIVPIEEHKKPTDQINLIYHTTPHRGLDVLVPVFKALYEKNNKLHLHVYSSFEIYGWKERDQPFEALFKEIEEHPGMTYHGFKPNEEIREALKQAHIFAYPCTWPETSCLALIEAMSAGCICVHPDTAALPETSGHWTYMYPFNEDKQKHAQQFFNALSVAVQTAEETIKAGFFTNQLRSQMSFISLFHNWELKKKHWEAFLRSFENEDRKIESRYSSFEYVV